ncbi:MAG: hypothetical protein AAB405_01500 [Patescibacteria group bacterium]
MVTIIVTVAVRSPCRNCDSGVDRLDCSKTCSALSQYQMLIDDIYGEEHSIGLSSAECSDNWFVYH